MKEDPAEERDRAGSPPGDDRSSAPSVASLSRRALPPGENPSVLFDSWLMRTAYTHYEVYPMHAALLSWPCACPSAPPCVLF